MKKVTIIMFSMLVIGSGVLAQNQYTISFEPEDAGVVIDSIHVVNLALDTTITLETGESLQLNGPTGIEGIADNIESGFLYPNPVNESATLCFNTNRSEEVMLLVCRTDGSTVLRQRQILEAGTHRFHLQIPVAGLYFVSVLKNDQTTSYEAVFTGAGSSRNAEIRYMGGEARSAKKSQSAELDIMDKSLEYTDGDVLHYVCYSGSNITVVADSPTSSKSVAVKFYRCEKDGQNYKVVEIGEQVWMAENLAYLPAVYPPTDMSIPEARYYVYNYEGSDVGEAKDYPTYQEYGVLYNWTVATGVCPQNWHLPDDTEWEQLRQFVIDDQGTSADLAEYLKTTTGWIDEDYGNGTDNYGFSLLPGGRVYDQSFTTATGYGWCWSATEISSDYANKYWTKINNSEFKASEATKDVAYSVRCVKD
jgi:uncharacterized protein (TIGR02145 family)